MSVQHFESHFVGWFFSGFGMAITFVLLLIDGICFVRVGPTFIEHVPERRFGYVTNMLLV